MTKLKPGVKVVVIDENHNVQRGTITSSFEPLEMAIVELENGSTIKACFKSLGIDEQIEEQVEEQVEPVEIDKEITIGKDEFMNKVAEAMGTFKNDVGFKTMLLFTALGARLTTILFDIEEND